MDDYGFPIVLNSGFRHAVRDDHFHQRSAILAGVSNFEIHLKGKKKKNKARYIESPGVSSFRFFRQETSSGKDNCKFTKAPPPLSRGQWIVNSGHWPVGIGGQAQ